MKESGHTSRGVVGLMMMCALVLLMCVRAAAQSSEINFPTPVRSAEIAGAIAARDVGDPRPTTYFYTFDATPGDLLITIESVNLNGDVDLFTANNLRPLTKISLYALGANATSASKSVFLRRRESLILRIEARSPNDDAGTYRIRFSGSFEPASGDIAAAPETPAVAASATRIDKNVRRVTSVGGRIEEPKDEANAAANTEKNVPPEKVAEKEPIAAIKAQPSTLPKIESRNSSTSSTARARRGGARRSSRSSTARAKPTSVENNNAAPASTAAATEAKASPPLGARLIIEMRDGMKTERYMSAIRRVTVNNGQLIVITKDGKVERLLMSDVLRMAIEP